MPPRRAKLAGLVLAGALASCGRMTDGHYDPPALGWIGGTLDWAGTPTVDGPVLMALSWLPAEETGAFFRLPGQGAASPFSTLTCSETGISTNCVGLPWSGHVSCLASEEALLGLARTVTYEARFPAAFSLPVDDLPPARARYPLEREGGRGSLSLAAVVAFVDEDGDGRIRFGTPERAPERAIADSAVQTYSPASGVARTSYYVAFLDGEMEPAYLADGYGALAGLPQGFSLWTRTETPGDSGNTLTAEYAVRPLEAPVELHGYAGIEGLAIWCTERLIEELWLQAMPLDGPPFRCALVADTTRCRRTITTAPCTQRDEIYQVTSHCGGGQSGPCGEDGWSVGPMPARITRTVRLDMEYLLLVGTDPAGIATHFYGTTLGAWWPAGSLAVPRFGASVTVLDSGMVLVAGSSSPVEAEGRSAELFDPTTGIWTPTGAMATARAGHSATLLPSGKVLVVGGTNGDDPSGLRSAELFDPDTGTWAAAATPPVRRGWNVATLLFQGQVLVAGDEGATLAAELYDPSQDAWRNAGPMRWPHSHGTFTLIPDGRVVALGSSVGDATAAEAFDPASATWTPIAAMPTGRWDHGAAMIPWGHLLVAGGSPCLSSADLYDPATDAWRPADPMPEGRADFDFVFFGVFDSRLVAAGGEACGGNLPLAQAYCEPPGVFAGDLRTAASSVAAEAVP